MDNKPQVDAVVVYNRGVKYLEKRRFDKAMPLFKKALKTFNFKEAHLNIANCYKAIHNDEKAVEHYHASNDPLVPTADGNFLKQYGLALNNLGLMAYKYEHDQEAILLYAETLKLEPQNENSKFNAGIAKLRQCSSGKSTDWELAWKLYESRFSVTDRPTFLKGSKAGLKKWDGVSSMGSCVIMAEQGFGDSLMFARYIPEVPASKIWVQCDPASAPLFRYAGYLTCFDTIETDATHAIPFGNLGLSMPHFGIIPGEWLSGMNAPGNKTGKIGVVWSGSAAHANDSIRSVRPERFKRFSKYGELITLNPSEHGKAFTPGNNKTWMETVDLVNKLDLVVAVDTSIVHLCGAMGKPCVVIMPLADTDFRWGDSSLGSKNMWHPSVTVVRNKNNWENAFDKAEEYVKEYCR